MQLVQCPLESILDQVVGTRAFPGQRTRIAPQTRYMGNHIAAGTVHCSITGGRRKSPSNACCSGLKAHHRLCSWFAIAWKLLHPDKHFAALFIPVRNFSCRARIHRAVEPLIFGWALRPEKPSPAREI